jgi:hypothetical protein
MISWVGQFGTITAPFGGRSFLLGNIMIGQVEGGEASAWLQSEEANKRIVEGV